MEVSTNERGQALPLVVMAVVAAALGVIGLGRLAGVVVDHAHATTAADAAALSGVVGGESSARTVARANGAVLVGFEELAGGDVRVVVRYGHATTSARARCGSSPSVGSRCGPGFSHRGGG